MGIFEHHTLYLSRGDEDSPQGFWSGQTGAAHIPALALSLQVKHGNTGTEQVREVMEKDEAVAQYWHQ